ncbi:E3 ubiquitin-protein ligase rnf13 [Apophysomyces ossiformis]|uniref:E3 ubiquitin-protein ligase rnf13 n=1 Tax=Apophysomyces ossiformis TaxID=679940 RepID=A0A8H7BQ59_9FUNG|nr:E3 ubiquitin-protein ligase rnf13 [Apophysomyces ossiformis]
MLLYYARLQMVLMLLLLGYMPGAMSQTAFNPAFEQEPLVYNASDPRDKGIELKAESRVAISQGFQVVFAGDDIRHAARVALIKNISETNSLNVQGILIFDNNTTPSNLKYQMQNPTGWITAPMYPSPLPPEFNISNMADNDLRDRWPFVPTYFATNDYGQFLLEKIVLGGANSTMDTYRQFWEVTAFLGPVNFGNDDSNSFMSALASSRGYLSYIIALAAIFLIGVIFLRWWRIRRMRDEMGNDLAHQGANAYMLQQRSRQSDPLPVDLVNALPIEKYTVEGVKNANCAICLEDFVEDKTEVRVLPCGHGFCVLCIDPWLTQKSTLCPICKWDCMPPERRQQAQSPEADREISETTSGPSSSNSISMDRSTPSPSNSHPPIQDSSAQAETASPSESSGSAEQQQGQQHQRQQQEQRQQGEDIPPHEHAPRQS